MPPPNTITPDNFARAQRVVALHGCTPFAPGQRGPLIRHNETNRIHEWMNDAGAELICGGHKLSDSCHEATVLFNTPLEATIPSSEIFGPVDHVYPPR